MKGACEVWLYGSRARGNADRDSDTDLLVVAEEEEFVKEAIGGLAFPKINVSFYSWAEVNRMRAYGSLYLHHIAEEGVRLRSFGSSHMQDLLDDLPQFTRAKDDLYGFRQAFEESVSSLDDGGWPDFECEVIATVARHAAILGSYCAGSPAFGRERPFYIAGTALGYKDSEIKKLLYPATRWRFHQTGSHEGSAQTAVWLASVKQFLSDLEEVINDYSSILPVTA